MAVYNSNSDSQSRLFDFFSNQTTKNFIEVLEQDLILNSGNSRYLENTIKCYESTRGINEAKFINSLCQIKDGKRNELNEKELKLLSDLQKLNISLIKNHTQEQKRKQMLFEYSQNFKIINNI